MKYINKDYKNKIYHLKKKKILLVHYHVFHHLMHANLNKI